MIRLEGQSGEKRNGVSEHRKQVKKLEIKLITLVLVIVGWLSGLTGFGLSGYAQAQTASGLPTGVQLETNAVQPDFPVGITFQFKANQATGGTSFKSLDLAFHLEGEVATTIRHKKLAVGDPLQVEFKIDNRDNYFPPGSRLFYSWLLTDDHNQVYQTAIQNFTYQDKRYQFKELQQGVVTVRWYQGNQVFGQSVLDKAQSTIDKLSQLYKVKPDHPINITIYPDSRTMFTALPPNTEEWVGGQAIPELGTVVLAIAPGDTKEVGRSVPHEVSHQVVYQATRNPYNVPPKWLDEGLAVNNQDEVDRFLQDAFQQGQVKRTLYPLRVLDGSFPADSQQSFLAYGESVQVVRYIIKKYGEGAMERMLAAFKQGLSYDEILETAIGRNIDQLDREWKQSINYPLATLPNPTPDLQPAIPTLAPVPVLTFSPTKAATTSVIPVGSATVAASATPEPEPALEPTLVVAQASPAQAIAGVSPTTASRIQVGRNDPGARVDSSDPVSPLSGLLLGAGLIGVAGVAGTGWLVLNRFRAKKRR